MYWWIYLFENRNKRKKENFYCTIYLQLLNNSVIEYIICTLKKKLFIYSSLTIYPLKWVFNFEWELIYATSMWDIGSKGVH